MKTPIPTSRRTALMLAPALLLTLATGAAAQGFPTKPIKLVLPYSPGGIIDYVGRSWPSI